MKYKKATYQSVMMCPECGFNKGVDIGEGDGMPDRYDFISRIDYDGIEYIECLCGCKFVI